MKNKTIWLFTLFLIFTYSFAYGYTSLTIWNNLENTEEVNSSSIENYINLESESAILIETTTGKILFEKDIHKKLRPASVTKIMSLLLIMEALDRGDISLETQIPCSENASSMGGSQIWLDSTESLSVEEMLKAICVVSANDCTVAMAEYLCGSEELFVQKMNERAKELGMNDTTFKNCHGIDEDGHLTSSYDISLMSKELLNNHSKITKYTTIWMDSLRDGESELVNTNKLIRTYDGATGLKTGSTSLALYNLSASATRNDLSLIAVVLKAPTPKIRFSEAKLLLDYGFSNYSFKKLCQKDDIYQNVSVNKGTEESVNLIYEKDVGSILKKSSSDNISKKITINENIEAPIYKGDILGNISYFNGDSQVATVNLIAENDGQKSSLINIFKDIAFSWFSLLKQYS